MAFHPVVEASGLGGFTNSPLAQLYLYDKIMDRYYEQDFLAEITNSEINERITSCAQEVQIIKAVDVGPWSSYVAGQPMQYNKVTFSATKLAVCYAAYLAFSFDYTQIHYTCDWARYEEKILESAYERFVEFQRKFVFTELIHLAAPTNSGNNAGKYRNINLGAPGNPFHITPLSLPIFMGNLSLVLTEPIHWVQGQMYLIVPPQFRSVFSLSNYANQDWTGSAAVVSNIEGTWNQAIAGFNIFQSVHLPSFQDTTGHQCFYMIAGHKDAYSYAADIIAERVKEDVDSFTVKYQMLAAWGGAMLFPKFVAVAYGYFDTTISV